MKNYPQEINDFYDYCISFYDNNTGLYPIATKGRIVQATNIYLESKPLSEIYFDSVDREMVRKIIEPNYSLV